MPVHGAYTRPKSMITTVLPQLPRLRMFRSKEPRHGTMRSARTAGAGAHGGRRRTRRAQAHTEGAGAHGGRRRGRGDLGGMRAPALGGMQAPALGGCGRQLWADAGASSGRIRAPALGGMRAPALGGSGRQLSAGCGRQLWADAGASSGRMRAGTAGRTAGRPYAEPDFGGSFAWTVPAEWGKSGWPGSGGRRLRTVPAVVTCDSRQRWTGLPADF